MQHYILLRGHSYVTLRGRSYVTLWGGRGEGAQLKSDDKGRGVKNLFSKNFKIGAPKTLSTNKH